MENVIEDNKMIAEFMGYTFSKSGLTARIGKGKKPSAYRLSDLHYNTSWNLLMPVVEKIGQFKYEDGETAYPRTFGMPFADGLEESEQTIMVRFNRQPVSHGKTLIEATYLAVIDFITGQQLTKNP